MPPSWTLKQKGGCRENVSCCSGNDSSSHVKHRRHNHPPSIAACHLLRSQRRRWLSESALISACLDQRAAERHAGRARGMHTHIQACGSESCRLGCHVVVMPEFQQCKCCLQWCHSHSGPLDYPRSPLVSSGEAHQIRSCCVQSARHQTLTGRSQVLQSCSSASRLYHLHHIYREQMKWCSLNKINKM